jgi:hypothetical protein
MDLVEALATERQMVVDMSEVGGCRAITQGLAAGPAASAHEHARRSSSAFSASVSVFRRTKVPRPGPGPWFS